MLFTKSIKYISFLSILSAWALMSCAKVYTKTVAKERPALPDTSMVYNFYNSDKIYGDYEVLGTLKVNTKNLYTCDYYKFRSETQSIAREMGGNALILKEVDFNFNRNMSNVCYNFVSDVAHVNFYKDTVLYPEETLKKEWLKKFDPIEGIYESTGPAMSDMKLGVLKNNTNGYSIYYLEGVPSDFKSLWQEGSLKAILSPTGSPSNFKTSWVKNNRSYDEDFITSFQGGFMNIIQPATEINQPFLKIYPTENTLTTASGTGFAISKEGYIVTNNHVVEGANNVVVKGINGDFSVEFEAQVIITDEKNDLAILKIDNLEQPLENIPYSISKELSSVGESIFVLGYPLRATMGDEIKLTSGLISSRTGYQGDVTLYQVSAATQPGNSGGPMIDQSGNVVGIISAKHAGAENATYAIKSQYLLNLLELLPEGTDFSSSTSDSLKFSERISLVSNFTYIIERK